MNIYLVTSGDYSDYEVICAFECEEDGLTYVRQYNANYLQERHDRNIATDIIPANAHLKCVGEIENCPSCGKYYSYHLHDYARRLEDVEFYREGTIPIRVTI